MPRAKSSQQCTSPSSDVATGNFSRDLKKNQDNNTAIKKKNLCKHKTLDH